MSSFHFEFFLCLNGHPVPMLRQTLLVIDLGLAEGLEGLALEDMEADLVSITVDPPGLGIAFEFVGVAKQHDPIALGDS